MKSFFLKTLTTGIFLLIPLTVLGLALHKIFSLLRKLVAPMAEKFGIDTLSQLIVLDIVAVGLLVAAILALGLVAYIPVVAKRADKLDRLLSDRIAGYSIIKGVIGGALKQDTSVTDFHTVLVRVGDNARIGFEVERSDEGGVIVFLPDTPNPQTGTSMAFLPEDVERLNIAPRKAMEMLNFFGKGIGGALEAAREQRSVLRAA